jgi:hypothetical protein
MDEYVASDNPVNSAAIEGVNLFEHSPVAPRNKFCRILRVSFLQLVKLKRSVCCLVKSLDRIES